ncbi:hypothetical protein NEOC65_000001 [Neochlamydia sp. AcF65]|uniref:hypothetical protein n=1 Tax=Neochlamydia sp. AcF65 TaxID=2795735 RepID=UPI001BCA2A8C|nr:hypothetical protein [Neochlamydia sp. AcF65]MBS4164956.1 hypothetical protein [Neochlamydia sp. AcF65]
MNTRKTFSQAWIDLKAIVNHVAFFPYRYILTYKGKDLAAIAPIEDLEMLEALDDERDIEVA